MAAPSRARAISSAHYVCAPGGQSRLHRKGRAIVWRPVSQSQKINESITDLMRSRRVKSTPPSPLRLPLRPLRLPRPPPMKKWSVSLCAWSTSTQSPLRARKCHLRRHLRLRRRLSRGRVEVVCPSAFVPQGRYVTLLESPGSLSGPCWNPQGSLELLSLLFGIRALCVFLLSSFIFRYT